MTVTTSSARQIMTYAQQLYERIVDPTAPIHRFNLTCNNVIDEAYQQYDLFCDPEELEKEHRLQKAMLEIKGKFGKNAILKGMNLQEGATAMERNRQIGGHKSGE
jgi:DNA polymerase V